MPSRVCFYSWNAHVGRDTKQSYLSEINISCFRFIDGEYYIIAGSKNVHLLCKTYADIDLYTDTRYAVAKTVAISVLNTFQKMSESQLIWLKQLLNATKMTVVCEVLQPDYQHIVDLSYLKEATVNFLMFCSVATERTVSFTAIPPHLGLVLAETFGLSTPKYFSIPTNKVPDIIIQVSLLHKTSSSSRLNSGSFLLHVESRASTLQKTKIKLLNWVRAFHPPLSPIWLLCSPQFVNQNMLAAM